MAASTLSGELKDKLSGLKKADAAKEVGRLLAARAKEKGIPKWSSTVTASSITAGSRPWPIAAGKTDWNFSRSCQFAAFS